MYAEGARSRTCANFDESAWVRIRLKGKHTLLAGCIYRSPQSPLQNNEQLRQLLREVSQSNASSLLITGDFNYPDIDWGSWIPNRDNPENEEFQFIESLRDTYLYQYVNQNTRGRGSDTPHLLDLVLTSEEGMVDNIHYEAPLGKSDHCTLRFDLNCATEVHEKTFKKFIYDKGDYVKLGEDMRLNWREKLQFGDTETKWQIIKSILREAVEKHIPRKISKPSSNRYTGGIPLDQVTISATKKKHRAWQRYMETRSAENYRKYTRQ